jgi:hypothetical protein
MNIVEPDVGALKNYDRGLQNSETMTEQWHSQILDALNSSSPIDNL